MKAVNPLRTSSLFLLMMLQVLLLGLIGIVGFPFLRAAAGFQPALLLAGLYGVATTGAVWQLGSFIAQARPVEEAPPGRTGRARGGLGALLLVECGLLVCFGIAQLAPYSALDLPRRAQGYQGLLEPGGSLRDASFSNDGQHLMLGGTAGLAFWSVSERALRQRFATGGRTVSRALISPDSRMVAALLDDSSVRLWDASSGALLRSLPPTSGGRLSFSPSSAVLVTAGDGQPAQIWRVSDGQLLKTYDYTERTFNMVVFDKHDQVRNFTEWSWADKWRTSALAADHRRIARGSGFGEIQLWKPDDEAWQHLHGHSGAIKRLTFSPDGKLLASSDSDSVVRVWRVGDRRLLAAYLVQTAADALAFAPDNRTLAVGAGQTVTFWRIPPQQ